MAAELLASDVMPPRMISSRGMMGMLSRLESDSAGDYIFKLHPPTSTFFANRAGVCSDWSWLPDSARKSATGLALLYVKSADASFEPRLAIAPPFPIEREVETRDRETLVGVRSIRRCMWGLSSYGMAMSRSESHTMTNRSSSPRQTSRWVPNKHRAGGQSANRFKRSREKWAREFFDKASRLTTERFGDYPHRIDYLIFGGDRHVIKQFLQRAKLPNGLDERVLGRRINTLRPNRNALKDAVRQAWSSTVYELRGEL